MTGPDAGEATAWPDLLSLLVARKHLEPRHTDWAMGRILAGEATPAQIAAFAALLRAKGETVGEIEGLVSAMRTHGVPLSVPGRCLDVVGTGGDRSNSVNISTMSAIVAAAAGVRVVKHGNRSASSASGAADVLEALGIRLDLAADQVAAMASEVGITFAFAAAFHPAMRHAGPPRRELGIATTFNFLGPLANPAEPAAMAVGCADPDMAPTMAAVLGARGVDAWVFRGEDGLDEITTTGTSRIWAQEADAVAPTEHTIDPADLGIDRATVGDLRGGDAQHNAQVVRRLVAGERGAVRDAVLLNAGAALAVHAAESGGLIERIQRGVRRAEAAIDDGSASALLARWITASRAA